MLHRREETETQKGEVFSEQPARRPNMSNQHAKTSVKNDGFPFHSGLFGVSRYKLTTKISKKDHCEIV
jgi:hypothetical protein